MTKMLTAQDEISQEIANTLSRTFGITSTTGNPSLSTRNVDAYDAFLRGVWHLKGRSPGTETGAMSPHLHHAQIHIGATLAQLGRPGEATRWLTMAANQGYPSYTRFSNDRNLDPLRGQEEFEALLARLRQDHQRWQLMPCI
jgi:hypothetical protein